MKKVLLMIALMSGLNVYAIEKLNTRGRTGVRLTPAEQAELNKQLQAQQPTSYSVQGYSNNPTATYPKLPGASTSSSLATDIFSGRLR